jgi:hypothetical protein
MGSMLYFGGFSLGVGTLYFIATPLLVPDVGVL